VVFARVPCEEFKVRNEGQKQNIIAISKFFLFLFDSNDVNATNAFEKINVTGDRSNNSGVWEWSRQPPEANGVWSGTPNTAAIFQIFSKNKAFLCMFWSKFLLRNLVLNDCKVVVDASSRPEPKTLLQHFQKITHF